MQDHWPLARTATDASGGVFVVGQVAVAEWALHQLAVWFAWEVGVDDCRDQLAAFGLARGGRSVQNACVDVFQVVLTDGRSAEVGVVGPDNGTAVLYFHSPSTSGEELTAATSAATRHGLRLHTVRRPSLQCNDPEQFVTAVARDVEAIAETLALWRPAVLAWSGGAPYALAASARLGPKAGPVHLVSPLPGPLTGPAAVPDQSARLLQVAGTNAASSWASGPAALRDYQAVAAPWTFDLSSIVVPVTLWAPADDQIVPPRLVDYLARSLPNPEVIAVPGEHDWLTNNWETVLERLRD